MLIGTRYIVYTVQIFRLPDLLSNTVQASHQPVLHQILNSNGPSLSRYLMHNAVPSNTVFCHLTYNDHVMLYRPVSNIHKSVLNNR